MNRDKLKVSTHFHLANMMTHPKTTQICNSKAEVPSLAKKIKKINFQKNYYFKAKTSI